MHETLYDKFKQYKNYAIIGVISLICLFILPFFNSTIGLQFTFPNTAAGWIVFTFNKLLVATVNLLILYCFVEQGKFNVRNDPRYIEARDILLVDCDCEEVKPQSPAQHYLSIYGKKGCTLFITTILASFSLTQAVLAFDLASFVSYTITIIIGVIFGIIQMGSEEIWWTEDYWRYAQMVKKNNEKQSEIKREESGVCKCIENTFDNNLALKNKENYNENEQGEQE